MNRSRQSLRLGAALILFAVFLRLPLMSLLQRAADRLSQSDISSLLIYLETGRIVRFSQSSGDVPVFAGESPPPDFTQTTSPALPRFTGADAAAVDIKYNCNLSPDLAALMEAPLSWDLTGDAPTVLILHTHATESYTKSMGESYQETSAFRTLDEGYNMLSVGEYLAGLLEAGGIRVVQDRQLHDYPSYNGSYNHARKSMEQYLSQYPSIQLVLDLHRDASGSNYNQMRTHATVAGKDSAQIMLVVGTSASGLTHPNWEQNLSLALKLHTQLERAAPGICRYINLRGQRFNQDKHPGALLVEVGAAGNTHAEALTATEVLARAILELAKGSEPPIS